MSKKHRKKEPRHVRLYHFLLQTAAWRSLGPIERAMYVDIAQLYAGHGSNNGRIGYSVRSAAENLHIGKSSAARALETLQERGFIVATKRGAFSVKARHATEWRLTEFPCDVTGELASKDFARWSPENKTRYPQRDHTVSVAGPVGTCSGTTQSEDGLYGTCSGTVDEQIALSRYPQRDTYSLPGVSPSTCEPSTLERVGEGSDDEPEVTIDGRRATAAQATSLMRAQFTSEQFVGADRISRRHKCSHCGKRGETLEVHHGIAHPHLHRECIDDWIADYNDIHGGPYEEGPKTVGELVERWSKDGAQ